MFFKRNEVNPMNLKRLFFLILLFGSMSGCAQKQHVSMMTSGGKEVPTGHCPVGELCVMETRAPAGAFEFGSINSTTAYVQGTPKGEKPSVLLAGQTGGPTAATALGPAAVSGLFGVAANVGGAGMYGSAIRAASSTAARAGIAIAERQTRSGPGMVLINQVQGSEAFAGNWSQTGVRVDTQAGCNGGPC
jgi:hypothetical protein